MALITRSARLFGAAFFIMALASSPLSALAQGDTDTLTFHRDNARLGWNAKETRLTPERVQSAAFGKRWANELDGMVQGSPLYMAGLDMGGKKADVVFAATHQNSVYALNAADGAVLWAAKNLTPTLSGGEFNSNWRSREQHGILSTPVIDRKAGAIYVCTPKVRGLRQVYQAWGLDIRTGKILPGWPVTLNAEYKGVPFKAGQLMQRGALLVQDDWLYIPFGGRGDVPPWRGWIIGINIQKPDAPQRGFCASPGTDGAGIWSGGGVAALPTGEIFAITGNGDYDFPKGDNLAQTVLRLKTDKSGLTFSRKTQDYYTPANHLFLDEQDEDLGGATGLPLPPQPGTSTPNVLFTGGKDGCAYLLNRDNLGGLGGELQKQRLFGKESATYHEGIRATSAYFDAGAAGRFVYVPGDEPGTDDNHGMVALKLSPESPGGAMRFTKVWTLKKDLARPSSPTVTSDGAKGGLVWVVEPESEENQGISFLHAYDALTGAELYQSERSPADRLEGGQKFVSVTAADGRIFVGAKGVYCYGLTQSATSETKGKAAK